MGKNKNKQDCKNETYGDLVKHGWTHEEDVESGGWAIYDSEGHHVDTFYEDDLEGFVEEYFLTKEKQYVNHNLFEEEEEE
jgi:phage pi2 protein 07